MERRKSRAFDRGEEGRPRAPRRRGKKQSGSARWVLWLLLGLALAGAAGAGTYLFLRKRGKATEDMSVSGSWMSTLAFSRGAMPSKRSRATSSEPCVASGRPPSWAHERCCGRTATAPAPTGPRRTSWQWWRRGGPGQWGVGRLGRCAGSGRVPRRRRRRRD